MPFQDLKTLPIRDFVIPLGSVSKDGAFTLEGTGFLVGSQGLVLTAGHVANSLMRELRAVALFVDGNKWQAVSIINSENHPLEDVAVVKLEGDQWNSIHSVSSSKEFASQNIIMWGYPEKIAQEIRQISEDPDLRLYGFNPDLIYMKGYIRRLLSRQMPTGILVGSAFYEISEAAGSCYSGSPVSVAQPGRTCEMVGVYVGEETGGQNRVGYVVRSEAFSDWVPKISGVALVDEKPTNS